MPGKKGISVSNKIIWAINLVASGTRSVGEHKTDPILIYLLEIILKGKNIILL